MKQTDKLAKVSISGAYWTGAGAVVDLLGEHSSFAVVPGEFTYFSFGQFFSDVFSPLLCEDVPEEALARHIRRMRGFDRSDMFPVRAFGRRVCRELGWYPELFFEHRTNAAKLFGADYAAASQSLVRYLEKGLRGAGNIETEVVSDMTDRLLTEAVTGYAASVGQESVDVGVFDQLVSPPYFDNAMQAVPGLKYINVHRDWRDQYVEVRSLLKKMMVRNLSLGIRPWGESFEANDLDHVGVFVSMRRHVDSVIEAQKQKHQAQVKWVDFEELIADTEKVAAEVFEFLEVEKAGWKPRQKLFPEKSARGIGKWKKPEWQTEELRNEFALIEERLGQ